MKTDVFHSEFPFAKQKEIAIYFLARLRSLDQADYPCYDHQSACVLARVLQQEDRERLVQTIHIHRGYVRIIRNNRGLLSFASVVLDHVNTKVTIPEG